MAIEEYGASLLSDVRRRQDKQAKQMRKEQERTALMGLGLGLGVQVGNEYLRNKAQSFFNNEDTLKKRTEFKSMYRAAERTLEERQQYEKMGENYFLQQALTEISGPLKAAAGSNYDPDKFTAVQYTLAQKRAQELKANYEKTIEAADKFVSSAGADPEAYNKALLSTRPKSIGEAVRMSVGNYFGGDDNAMHNANLNTLDTSLGRYREAYAQTKNPWASRTVAQLYEDFKDFDFGETPLSMKESKSIKVPDGMGGYRDQEAIVVKQGDNIVGYVDALSRKPIKESVAGDNARIKRQRMPTEVAEATRQSFLATINTDSGAGKIIRDYYETQSGTDPRNTSRKEGALKDIFGGLYQTSASIKQRMPVRDDVALLISAEMHAMNIENTREDVGFIFEDMRNRPQYNLLATKDSFSPILALAALERLERKEEGSQVGLNERRIAELRGAILSNSTDSDYIESFGDLSMASKLYTLRWMKDYDTFTAPIN
ncbi:MAG: hypothetical protein ACO2Y4_06165, partial [Burkholderiaceae bacterium]